MSKYVKNYWVEELPNGVIHLLINLTQREVYHHRFFDNLFLIAGTEKEFEEHSAECILNTEDFLPKNNDVFMYIKSSMHEKDQLSYYYIPYKKEWIKDRKYLIKP